MLYVTCFVASYINIKLVGLCIKQQCLEIRWVELFLNVEKLETDNKTCTNV